jgi:hypothetical protein
MHVENASWKGYYFPPTVLTTGNPRDLQCAMTSALCPKSSRQSMTQSKGGTVAPLVVVVAVDPPTTTLSSSGDSNAAQLDSSKKFASRFTRQYGLIARTRSAKASTLSSPVA